MAFEDRCSPNQANSPGPVTGRVPAPHSENLPTAYNPPSQYTCTTIDQRFNRTQNMTVVKVQPTSPPSSPNQAAHEESNAYQNYYQNERPETPDIKPLIRQERPQVNLGLNFSISNILHPEFGLTAIRQTNKIEGPKPVGPNHSILYKPYDLSKAKAGVPIKNPYSFDYVKSKPDDRNRLPPLGGLRQTISQIGAQKELDVPQKSLDVTPQKRPDSANSMVSSTSSGAPSTCSGQDTVQGPNGQMWPAWVFCTRYSDRPSSGPRSRRSKKNRIPEEKRPRTAFSGAQLSRLKHEFAENRYLTERRRQQLAGELGLAEAQIKIWFQNKRAKIKKASGQRNPLALQLMAQGLYNHSTATESEEEEEISVT